MTRDLGRDPTLQEIAQELAMPIEEIIRRAKKTEEDGANAIYLVTTGSYRTKRLIETIRELRPHLKKKRS